MTGRFLQIHFLTSYPASLLNRDDAGLAKRIVFGGATRTRVSSQCQKRHWRTFDDEVGGGLAGLEPLSVRSRVAFQKYVVEPLVEQGVAPETAALVATELQALILGESEAAAQKRDGDEGDAKGGKGRKGRKKDVAEAEAAAGTDAGAAPAVATKQVVVLGRKELDYIRTIASEICKSEPKDAKAAKEAVKAAVDKEAKKNLQTLVRGAGLDAAMFGRMITGDILARVDAAVHVAHAFTVHEEQSEADYFSAIDDIVRDAGEAGSGHINSSELTSGLFYGYVVVDVPLLISNLGDDRKLAAGVLERLVHLVATVSPGAKLGATAPYAYAHAVMCEFGRAQPRTLANAFLSPVRSGDDLIESAYRQVVSHLVDLDEAYPRQKAERIHLATGNGKAALVPVAGERVSLEQLAQWAAARIPTEG